MAQRRSAPALQDDAAVPVVPQAQLGPGPYRIQVASALCGIPATTLRAWERRYGIPSPKRSAGAYRLYDADDVALLTRMRFLVDDGVAPSDAARVARADHEATTTDSAAASITIGLGMACDRILGATHRWDPMAIDAELTRLSMLVDAQTLFERVISPVLGEIGRRWERGEVSIAQEHMLSERLEVAVRASLRAMDRTEGPLALIACIDCEQHVLGALGAALRFAANGARTVVLGAMMPPEAIGDAVRSMSPRVVGLSTSVSPPGARALFRAYGKACGKTPWVVGGAAAESLRGAVEAAGGQIAGGPSSQWSQQVREWLRGGR